MAKRPQIQKKRLTSRFNLQKSRFVIFALVFGILGVVYLRFSHAADVEHPLGFADYCALENGDTVIYGWAHDNDAPAGAYPYVTLSSNGVRTVPTDISYRESQIDNYLSSYGRPTSNVYGFRAAFPNKFRGETHYISGTISNYGNGTDQPLWINTSGGVDGSNLLYFANNRIPDACMNPLPAVPSVTVTISPTSVVYNGARP